MSDGTNRLYIRDPETFEELDTIDVYDGARAIWNLNELEVVDGEIWANVWQTDRIARIDPETGQVTGWIDLTGLLSENDRDETPGRRPQRHRLRPGDRASLRHGQAVAEALRDRGGAAVMG